MACCPAALRLRGPTGRMPDGRSGKRRATRQNTGAESVSRASVAAPGKIPVQNLYPGQVSRRPAKYRRRICSPGKAFTPPPGNNARSGSLTYQLFEQCKGLFHSLLADHKSTQLACCPAALRLRGPTGRMPNGRSGKRRGTRQNTDAEFVARVRRLRRHPGITPVRAA